ncbi:MAG TPA: hypothetical protein VGI54_01490 [Solirubrobacteraceae bacterium]
MLVLAAVTAVAGCGAPEAPKGFPAQATTEARPAVPGSHLPKGETAVYDLTQLAYARPEHLELADHDDARGVVWADWGAGEAVGHGILTTSPCTPDCATATPLRVHAEVLLSQPKRCFGRPWYDRAVVVFADDGRTKRLTEPVSAPC